MCIKTLKIYAHMIRMHEFYLLVILSLSLSLDRVSSIWFVGKVYFFLTLQ